MIIFSPARRLFRYTAFFFIGSFQLGNQLHSHADVLWRVCMLAYRRA
jgi:hypothetical protein